MSDPAGHDQCCVRERLLDAAEDVVGRDGVVNLTLDAVAKQAHLSKGGLLYHFPSKSALVTAVIERRVGQFESLQQEFLAQEPKEPGAYVRAYLKSRLAHVARTPRNVHLSLMAAAGTDPQYLEPVRRCSTAWQARLEADAIDPVDATIVRLAIDGLGIGELMGLPVPAGDFRQRILDRLMQLGGASAACSANQHEQRESKKESNKE